ncbi:MAG: DMT family transporter [Bacteroidales bacterium]|nr:DMT family transporter [Bacteroidales bacterium]
MRQKDNWIFHILAFAVVLIWGTTFVSTKILINNGLTAIDIFIARFLLAYIVLCFIAPKQIFSASILDELLFLCMGITGGSLYFLTENIALSYSFASNVSLIVCTTPIFTSILIGCISKTELFSKKQMLGSLLAFIGMALVVLNGKFVLNLSPIGDILALAAAWSWAFYSFIMKRMANNYSSLFITRKVFFYGLISAIPVAAYFGLTYNTEILSKPIVFGNLLFLGLIASLLCYVLWNIIMKRIGIIKASNYIYINPVVAVICSAIILHENITFFAIGGMILILCGLFIAEKK